MSRAEGAGVVVGIGIVLVLASLALITLGYLDGEGLASADWFGVAVGVVLVVRYWKMRKAGPVE